jgi:hypothetical protein
VSPEWRRAVGAIPDGIAILLGMLLQQGNCRFAQA